jgi:hypothetical protein
MTRITSICICLVACNSQSADSPDASSQPDVDAMSAPTHEGDIVIEMIVPGFNGDPTTTNISGGIVSKEGTCTRATSSMCEVVSCPSGAQEMFAAPGMLHVGTPTGSFGVDPGEFAITYSANEVPWAAGDPIPVKTDGKTVPMFSTTLTTPHVVDAGFNGPVLTQNMSRSTALHVTWMPQPGEVDVVVHQTAANTPTTTITCAFNGSAGAGDIPGEATAKLAVSTDAAKLGDTKVRWYAADTKAIVAGDYGVNVRVLRGYYDQYKQYEVQ